MLLAERVHMHSSRSVFDTNLACLPASCRAVASKIAIIASSACLPRTAGDRRCRRGWRVRTRRRLQRWLSWPPLLLRPSCVTAAWTSWRAQRRCRRWARCRHTALPAVDLNLHCRKTRQAH
jgi:hypothetical protein